MSTCKTIIFTVTSVCCEPSELQKLTSLAESSDSLHSTISSAIIISGSNSSGSCRLTCDWIAGGWLLVHSFDVFACIHTDYFGNLFWESLFSGLEWITGLLEWTTGTVHMHACINGKVASLLCVLSEATAPNLLRIFTSSLDPPQFLTASIAGQFTKLFIRYLPNMSNHLFKIIQVRIGFTQDAYDVTEDAGFAIVIVEILNGTLASEREVIITLQTRDGTAVSDPAGEPDFMVRTIMFTFSSSVIATIVSIPIIDDLLLEMDREQFTSMLTLVTSDPDIILQPASVPIEIIDNDVPSCETEHTIITFKVDEKPLYWPEAQIGQTVFANCTCNNVTIAQASRFCGGDIATGATWENPDVSACNFTKTVGEICQLNQQANTGEILVALEELTEGDENIGVAGVSITTFILENLSLNIAQDQNRTMIESFLTVVDNLLAVDPSELQESQQLFNTSARLLEAIQTVTDILPIPENESHAVIALSSFAVAVQEVQADSVQQQSFSALLVGTLDGAINSNGLFFGIHPNATASVTLPAMIIPFSANVKTNTTIRITNSVYANDLLFLRREEESQEVGSIIISASISGNNSFANLDHPVHLTFIKNPNGTNTTCNFWDSAADSGFGDWSTRGCAVVSESEEDVICECDHLTNFAILLDVSPRVTDTSVPAGIKKTLEALSYIGPIISICFLILTIATYLSSKKLRSTEPTQLLVNICIGLLGIYIVYILAFHATAVSGLCVLAGVLVHYFLLATFFSMAADAILIFNKIIFVFVTIPRYVPIATIISWSVPAIIAVVTVAPDHDNYIDINFCRPYGIQFYAGLLAPFLVIYIFNWIIFTIILVFLINHYICKSKESVKTEYQGSQVRQQFRNAIVLSLLFGLGWALGLPATEGVDSTSARTAIQVLFIIVTAFQGLYIFIMQCLTGCNAVEVKKEWKRWFYLITCRPGHIPTYAFASPPVSASEKSGKDKDPKNEHHTCFSEIETSEQLQNSPAVAITQPYESNSGVLSNDN